MAQVPLQGDRNSLQPVRIRISGRPESNGVLIDIQAHLFIGKYSPEQIPDTGSGTHEFQLKPHGRLIGTGSVLQDCQHRFDDGAAAGNLLYLIGGSVLYLFCALAMLFRLGMGLIQSRGRARLFS